MSMIASAVLLVVFCIVVIVICLFIYKNDINENPKIRNYPSIFGIFFLLVGCWLGVLILLHRFGVLSSIDSALERFFSQALASVPKSSQISTDAPNVTPYATMCFTIGIAVLSFASQRQTARYNPYMLREYYHISIFLCASICLMTALCYFNLTHFYAIACVALFFLGIMCISQSAYYYLFHNPRQIEQNMARKMKTIIERNLSNKLDFDDDSSNIYCILEDCEEIFDNLVLWNRTLSQLNETSDIFKQARHHLNAIKLVLEDKKIQKYLEKEDSFLAFAFGYFTLYPSIGSCAKLNEIDLQHRAYYRAILELCKTELPFSHKMLIGNFLSGLLFARFQLKFDVMYSDRKKFNSNLLDEWITDAKMIWGEKWQPQISTSYSYSRNFWRACYIHVVSITTNTTLIERVMSCLCLVEPKEIGFESSDEEKILPMYKAFHRLTTYKLLFGPTPSIAERAIVDNIKTYRSNRNIRKSAIKQGGTAYAVKR